MNSPESESDQMLGAYVRMLQNAVTGFDPGDEQARYDVYRHAQSFLTGRLGERNDLSQSEIEAELRIFAEAALYVERQARSLHSVQPKAKPEPTLSDSAAQRRSSAGAAATSEKLNAKPAVSGPLAQQPLVTEPPAKVQPRSELPREKFGMSAPGPRRSLGDAGDPVKEPEPQAPAKAKPELTPSDSGVRRHSSAGSSARLNAKPAVSGPLAQQPPATEPPAKVQPRSELPREKFDMSAPGPHRSLGDAGDPVKKAEPQAPAKAKPEPTLSESAAQRRSNAGAVATAEKLNAKPAVSAPFAQQPVAAEPQAQVQPRAEVPRGQIKVSGPEPHRSAEAGDPIQKTEQQVSSKAKPELASSDSGVRPQSSAGAFATAEKLNAKPAVSATFAQPPLATEPQAHVQPRFELPRDQVKVSGAEPHRSSGEAGDPVQTADPQPPAKAMPELMPSDSGFRRTSNAKEFATSEKLNTKPAISVSFAQRPLATEPPEQAQPRSQGPREQFKVSGPGPHRSSSRAGDPVQTVEPQPPARTQKRSHLKAISGGLAGIYVRTRKLIERSAEPAVFSSGEMGRAFDGAKSSAPAEQNQDSTHRQIRLQAVMQVARHHGVELDVNELRVAASEPLPSAAALSTWAQNAGLWARAVRTSFKHLLRLSSAGPVVLLFKDGSAGLMVGVNAEQHVVLLKDPNASPDAQPVPVDELRLSQVWGGEAVLLRASRGGVAADAPFNLRWLLDLVLGERRFLRDIGIASITISFLTIFPPLLVMTMVNKVLQFHSVSTLILLASVMAVVIIYESLLGHARRLIIATVGARLDTRLNLHVFSRLLRLPLDYFERHPAGETMFRIAQVYKVREFLTGRLLTTFLDLITLCVLMPFLFYLSPILASIVLGCAVVILLIILAFLNSMREAFSRVTTAETWKAATLGETIVGIKTVKALALEPQRRAIWDERIADAGKWRLAFARLSNWPQTLVTPIERIMVLGTTMLGAYLAMNDPSGYMVGGLFAFMMLAGRAAQPLVGLARLIEEYEEIGAAVGEAASVLNRPAESNARSSGLRPKFAGEINFQDVTFTYLNTTTPALERVSFNVPAGTTLGIVGRSGSGKSTITRLLQGINRDYKGFVKVDGADLRDVDLRHLRQSLGVVLQDNFLFRGSIRDNIIAGRPGLTLSDAVYAARLAGAEEFIERMPNGFETYIEEGSPNLSGGQRQRLAIARALITDPRILILDEATSALDPESEAVVTANLESIASGRTMIIVSHRLSSLVDCDQILVMEQGRIVDCGKHEVLVERCAIYRQLWKQQNRHSEGPRPSAAPRLVSRGDSES